MCEAGRMRTSRVILCLATVLTPGCYAELVGGVTPRYKQEIVDGAGTASTTSNLGWRVALMLGFHFDYRMVGLGYSPVGATFTKVPASSPDMISAGHNVRLDVDLPTNSGYFRFLGTLAYTSINSVTVDATGNTTGTHRGRVPARPHETTAPRSGSALRARSPVRSGFAAIPTVDRTRS